MRRVERQQDRQRDVEAKWQEKQDKQEQTLLEVTVKNKAFTLVEILIVVIILGILAAIVIPQFTEASNDARISALQSDLQTCRSQFELYKVQHLENYPQAIVGSDSTKVI